MVSPESPIFNLEYEVKRYRGGIPFKSYEIGFEAKGVPYISEVKLKGNFDTLCRIKYWIKKPNCDESNLGSLLLDLFESFWKPSLRTLIGGIPDLKRDIKVSMIAQNTVY